MKFSIITPSYNQLPYLKRCLASVRDQISSSVPGLQVQHHIQDGGSTDGTIDWMARHAVQAADTNNYQLTFASEPDKGMYDALNKGFSRSSGDVFAWLNCDEQYLPGTLSFVADRFTAGPPADLLCGSALLIRPDGTLLAFRKACPLRRNYIAASHLYNLSCAMFFRRRVWEKEPYFDTAYRNLGDQDWVMRLLQNGIRTGCTGRFLSAFCFTGQNMSRSQAARTEEHVLRRKSSAWIRILRGPLNLLRLSEKVLHGAYHQPPFEYAVYPDSHAERREVFRAGKASFRWPEPQEDKDR